MTLEIWLTYLITLLVFMITPGPSHLLMLSNSLSNGFRRSTATAAGDLSANVLQMLAAAFGLASLLYSFQSYFIVIKWAGVAYLVFLGIKLLLTNSAAITTDRANPRSMHSLYWQGFITSAANPKAVIFFAALFPQFLSVSAPLAHQFLILGITYLIVDGLFLCFYGKFADYFAKHFIGTLGRYFNQLSGSLFIGAAVLLGLRDIDKR